MLILVLFSKFFSSDFEKNDLKCYLNEAKDRLEECAVGKMEYSDFILRCDDKQVLNENKDLNATTRTGEFCKKVQLFLLNLRNELNKRGVDVVERKLRNFTDLTRSLEDILSDNIKKSVEYATFKEIKLFYEKCQALRHELQVITQRKKDTTSERMGNDSDKIKKEINHNVNEFLTHLKDLSEEIEKDFKRRQSAFEAFLWTGKHDSLTVYTYTLNLNFDEIDIKRVELEKKLHAYTEMIPEEIVDDFDIKTYLLVKDVINGLTAVQKEIIRLLNMLGASTSTHVLKEFRRSDEFRRAVEIEKVDRLLIQNKDLLKVFTENLEKMLGLRDSMLKKLLDMEDELEATAYFLEFIMWIHHSDLEGQEIEFLVDSHRKNYGQNFPKAIQEKSSEELYQLHAEFLESLENGKIPEIQEVQDLQKARAIFHTLKQIHDIPRNFQGFFKNRVVRFLYMLEKEKTEYLLIPMSTFQFKKLLFSKRFKVFCDVISKWYGSEILIVFLASIVAFFSILKFFYY